MFREKKSRKKRQSESESERDEVVVWFRSGSIRVLPAAALTNAEMKSIGSDSQLCASAADPRPPSPDGEM